MGPPLPGPPPCPATLCAWRSFDVRMLWNALQELMPGGGFPPSWTQLCTCDFLQVGMEGGLQH